MSSANPKHFEPMKRRLLLLIRFGMVGVTVAASYALAYHVQFTLIGMGRFAANLIAFVLAIVLQYLLHATFTFKDRRVADGRQVMRFGTTVFAGYVISVVVTSILVPRGVLGEAVGTAVVVLLLPVVNLIVMGLWVFGERATRA